MSRKPSGATVLTGAVCLLAGGFLGYSMSTAAYPIDWSSTGAMMQGWAALLAASAAAWGVNKWQQEIRFKRNVEVAEKIMVAVEGLARAMAQARSRPIDYELDERVAGGVVLTRVSYELRHKVFSLTPYSAELEAMRDRVSAIFGKKHSDALTVLLAITNTVHWTFVECIGTTTGVENGQLDAEALQAMMPAAETLVPVTKRGHDLSAAFNQKLDAVRELFKSSI